MALDLLAKYRDLLPPMFAREAVEQLLPGIISASRLNNLDCEGKGPKGAMRIGRKVVYDRDRFLEWLEVDHGARLIAGAGGELPERIKPPRRAASRRG